MKMMSDSELSEEFETIYSRRSLGRSSVMHEEIVRDSAADRLRLEITLYRGGEMSDMSSASIELWIPAIGWTEVVGILRPETEFEPLSDIDVMISQIRRQLLTLAPQIVR